MDNLKNWNQFSHTLFEVPDPEDLPPRLFNWVKGPTVFPFVYLLDKAYNFGELDRENGENRDSIIQLCVDDEKTGRLIRAVAGASTEYGRNGHYARTIGLIIRENSFEGEILASKPWNYRQKCELVFQMIMLIQEDCPIARESSEESSELPTREPSLESDADSSEGRVGRPRTRD
jgi:hypothetical protein